MVASVIGIIHQNQILNGIVRFIAVNVMDNFIIMKRPSNMLFHSEED